MEMEDKNIINATVNEDQDGIWNLFIVPDKNCETYITEAELLAALAEIEASR